MKPGQIQRDDHMLILGDFAKLRDPLNLILIKLSLLTVT